MTPSVQIPLPGLPFDPAEVSKLSLLDRAALYDSLDLCGLQRQAAEDAVREVLAGNYRRRA